MTYRRDFLVSVGATTAAVGLGLSLPAAAVAKAGTGRPSAANRFARHLNGSFEFAGVDSLSGTSAQLVEIVDRSGDVRLDQFELVFRAPPGGELGEGVYRMTTPSGERSEHLVQPLAGRGTDRGFTVHFSLLV